MPILIPQSKPYKKFMEDIKQENKVKRVFQYYRFIRSFEAIFEEKEEIAFYPKRCQYDISKNKCWTKY